MGTNANNIIDDMKKLFEELYKTYETKDEKRQKEIMSELENIYKDNKKTKRRLLLVLTYSSELSKLTNKQDTKEDIKETVDKLKGIYEENKEDMFVAMSYVEGLANLITKQDTKKDIEDTVRDLDTVYDYYKKIGF